jgi:hypothetical protein
VVLLLLILLLILGMSLYTSTIRAVIAAVKPPHSSCTQLGKHSAIVELFFKLFLIIIDTSNNYRQKLLRQWR